MANRTTPPTTSAPGHTGWPAGQLSKFEVHPS